MTAILIQLLQRLAKVPLENTPLGTAFRHGLGVVSAWLAAQYGIPEASLDVFVTASFEFLIALAGILLSILLSLLKNHYASR